MANVEYQITTSDYQQDQAKDRLVVTNGLENFFALPRAGTANSIWRSTDIGVTWSSFLSLPNNALATMLIDSINRLHVANYSAAGPLVYSRFDPPSYAVVVNQQQITTVNAVDVSITLLSNPTNSLVYCFYRNGQYLAYKTLSGGTWSAETLEVDGGAGNIVRNDISWIGNNIFIVYQTLTLATGQPASEIFVKQLSQAAVQKSTSALADDNEVLQLADINGAWRAYFHILPGLYFSTTSLTQSLLFNMPLGHSFRGISQKSNGDVMIFYYGNDTTIKSRTHTVDGTLGDEVVESLSNAKDFGATYAYRQLSCRHFLRKTPSSITGKAGLYGRMAGGSWFFSDLALSSSVGSPDPSGADTELAYLSEWMGGDEAALIVQRPED